MRGVTDSFAFQCVVRVESVCGMKYSTFLRKRFAKPEKVRTFAIPKRSGLADETAALELREKIIEKTGD